jgi:anti-sigma-K factor RskA
LARSDPLLAEAVRQWEERLIPLAQELPAVAPPTRVWQAILKRTDSGKRGTREAKRRPSIWTNLSLWRGLALAGLASAFVLAVALFTPAPERPEGTLVIVLAAQDAKPALVASADRTGRVLTVKALAPVELPADRTLELWALPDGGNPRSLGLVPASGVVRLALARPADEALRNVPALAVSLEPRGGSPTGLPTGPVLYSGPVQRLY